MTNPPPSDPTKTLVRDGYNAHAQAYLSWTLPKPSSRTLYLDKLFTHLGGPSSLPSAAVVLELGCGAGIPVSVALAARCARLVANDISATQLALAADNLRAAAGGGALAKTELVESDMNALVFPSATFDAVVAFYSLIHLSRPDQTRALGQIHAWLKPGGWLVCNFAAEPDPGRTVDGWLGTVTMFWSSLGAEGSVRALEEAGFEVVEKEVVAELYDGGVEFLWVVARKV